jgi:thiol-disulfide isomerase/thioredoxin
MKKLSSLVILVIVVVLLIFTLVDTNMFAPVQPNAKETSQLSRISDAPEVTIPDQNGTFHHIGGESSKVTVLHFWASWCGPCEDEATSYVKLFEKYGDEISIVGINATNVDTEDDAQAFVRKHGWKFQILFDKKGIASESYHLIGYPTTFILNRKGEIVETLTGQQSYSKLEHHIRSQIK